MFFHLPSYVLSENLIIEMCLIMSHLGEDFLVAFYFCEDFLVAP